MMPPELDVALVVLKSTKGILGFLITVQVLLLLVRNIRVVVMTTLAFTGWLTLFYYFGLVGAAVGFVILGWIYVKTRRTA